MRISVEINVLKDFQEKIILKAIKLNVKARSKFIVIYAIEILTVIGI